MPPPLVNGSRAACSVARPRRVCILEMDCIHDGDLGTRWDWVSRDKSSASGWITCGRCGDLLQRLSYAAGRFRGQGWYLDPFLEQTVTGMRIAGLEELEVE